MRIKLESQADQAFQALQSEALKGESLLGGRQRPVARRNRLGLEPKYHLSDERRID